MIDPRFIENYSSHLAKSKKISELRAPYQTSILLDRLKKWWLALWNSLTQEDTAFSIDKEIGKQLTTSPLPDELKIPLLRRLQDRVEKTLQDYYPAVAADLLLDALIDALLTQPASLHILQLSHECFSSLEYLIDFPFVERFSKALLQEGAVLVNQWLSVLNQSPPELSQWVSKGCGGQELNSIETSYQWWLGKSLKDNWVWNPRRIQFLPIQDFQIFRFMLLYELNVKSLGKAIDQIKEPDLLHTVISFLSLYRDRQKLLELLQTAPLAYQDSGEWTGSFVAIIACLEAYTFLEKLLRKEEQFKRLNSNHTMTIPELHDELDTFLKQFVTVLSSRKDHTMLSLMLFDAISQDYHLSERYPFDLLEYQPKDRLIDALIDSLAESGLSATDVVQLLEQRAIFIQANPQTRDTSSLVFKISFLAFAVGILTCHQSQFGLQKPDADFYTEAQSVWESFHKHILDDYRLVSRFLIRYDEEMPSQWLIKIFGTLLAYQPNVTKSLQEYWQFLALSREQAIYTSDYEQRSRLNYSAFVIYMGLQASFLHHIWRLNTDIGKSLWQQSFDFAYEFWLISDTIYTIARSSYPLEMGFAYGWKIFSTEFLNVCQDKLKTLAFDPSVVLNILMLLYVNKIPWATIMQVNPLSIPILSAELVKQLKNQSKHSRGRPALDKASDIEQFAEELIHSKEGIGNSSIIESTIGIDMEAFNCVQVIENPWFEPCVTYEGDAELLVNGGMIKGPISVQYDESGEQHIEMEISSVYSETIHSPLLEHALVSGIFEDNQDSHTVHWTVEFNTCEKLTVDTPNGTFWADENIKIAGYSSSFSKIVNPPGSKLSKLKLYVSHGIFDVKNTIAKRKAYWVLPLVNFISDYQCRIEGFDRHPLRIYKTIADFNETLTEEQNDQIRSFIDIKSKSVIPFNFHRSVGFIEPLSDYKHREELLLSGKSRKIITSVMVGDIWDLPTDNPNQILEWIPYDFLWILSLSKGNTIGSSWIEIRDPDGNLSQRIHHSCHLADYMKGHRAIREQIHDYGTGNLLVQAKESQKFNTQFLRYLIDNIVNAGMNDLLIYDRFSSIFRAIDSLFSEYKIAETISTEDLISRIEVQETKNIVEELINEFKSGLDSLFQASLKSNNISDINLINRFKDKFSYFTIETNGFGKSLPKLLEEFDIIDLDLLNEEYKLNPRQDKRKKWEHVITKYRNIVMHGNSFDFENMINERESECDDIIDTLYHLHDILLRICFKILGYLGNYQPSILSYTATEELDWVNSIQELQIMRHLIS